MKPRWILVAAMALGCETENREAVSPDAAWQDAARQDAGAGEVSADAGADGALASDGALAGDGAIDSADGAAGPRADSTAPCEPGAVESVPCGLNRRGRQSHTCGDDGRWGEFGACDDPDTCVDGAREASPCGINRRGERFATCAAGQWGAPSECADPDECLDAVQASRPCGINGTGRESRGCDAGQWAPWACVDPDVCLDGSEEDDAGCGVAGNGTRSRRCAGGQWSQFGPCDDPDRVCEDGGEEARPCGLNARGEQRHACVDGRWGDFGACADPDDCVDEAAQLRACGVADGGTEVRGCARGAWGPWSDCDHPDAPPPCEDGAEEREACGFNRAGSRLRLCVDGGWSPWSQCDDPDVCEHFTDELEPCGIGGTRSRLCLGGQWLDWGGCRGGECEAGAARCAECTDRFDRNQSRETATPAPLNVRHEGLIMCDDADESDYFFVRPEGPTVVVVTARYAQPAMAVSLRLVDFSSGSVAGGGETRMDFVAPGATPTYFVAESRQLTVAYSLEVTAEPFPVCDRPDGAGCVPCPDPFEPNDHLDTASPIAVGTRLDGLGLCGGGFGGRDVFEFTVDDAGTYLVRATMDAALRFGGAFISHGLTDGAGHYPAGDFRGAEGRAYALEPGTYYVVAHANTGAARYALEVLRED